MSQISSLLALVLLANTLTLSSAWAEDKRASREREALQRARQQVQQITQEKAALEGKLAGYEEEKAALAQEKEKLAGKARNAEARASGEGRKRQQLQAALDAVTKEKESLLEQKSDLEKRLIEMTAKQTQSARELEATLAQKKQADATVISHKKQVASCEDQNLKLYQYGRDLIEQCRDRSATGAVLRLEPFTGIKRVEIENLLETYRDKLDKEKLQPTDSGPTAR